MIGNRFVLFANGRVERTSLNVEIHGDGAAEGLLFNLKPSTQYYYGVNGSVLTVSENPATGTPAMSSSMGVLHVNAKLTPKSSILLFLPLRKK